MVRSPIGMLPPSRQALENGLLPVVHGDVAFDSVRGGTIVSTEDIFKYLAVQLHPKRVLIAGIEAGVWADYPACTRIIERITPDNLDEILPALGGSAATDVTGGMASKVKEMCRAGSACPRPGDRDLLRSCILQYLRYPLRGII